MKKVFLVMLLSMSINSHAQFPIAEIIKAGIKNVIVAIDLRIQRIQKKTIWLQNAQKTLENAMSKLKLTEISDWMEKQRKQYDEYFQELKKVKATLTYYHRVKDIITDQLAIVSEYKNAWTLFRQDKNFSADEIAYMSEVYTGMLKKSGDHLDPLMMVVNAFATQMSDAKRMEIINKAANIMEQTMLDMKDFNNQNKLLSVQRSAARGEIDYVKKLYDL